MKLAALLLLSASIATADPTDIKKTIDRAHRAERSADWATAKAEYKKLETEKDWRGLALNGEAFAAFQMKDAGETIKLARLALNEPKADKVRAGILLGDGLFMAGEYAHAKAAYERIVATGDDKAIIAKKIRACDEKSKP